MSGTRTLSTYWTYVQQQINHQASHASEKTSSKFSQIASPGKHWAVVEKVCNRMSQRCYMSCHRSWKQPAAVITTLFRGRKMFGGWFAVMFFVARNMPIWNLICAFSWFEYYLSHNQNKRRWQHYNKLIDMNLYNLYKSDENVKDKPFSNIFLTWFPFIFCHDKYVICICNVPDMLSCPQCVVEEGIALF